MKKILLTALSLTILSTSILGCSKEISSDDDSVLITIEKNGVCGANQDIKVITWGKEELETYSIQNNDDGTRDVILHLSDSTKKYRKED